MNYRHAFHAGNFADVLKHATLALVIEHLRQKQAPFRMIDTHAGAGCYDLAASEALRTGEWQDGIGRLLGTSAPPLPDQVAALLATYLDVVRSANEPGEIRHYPGSSMLALRLLRPDDRLIANELHPDDARALESALGHDARAKVMTIDGWQALKALLPPKERRGVILIDPPFEEVGELDRLVAGAAAACRRFATGIYLLWFPIKDTTVHRKFCNSLTASGFDKLLLAELRVRQVEPGEKLSATGLVIINPPYQLDEKLEVLLSFLADRLAQGPGASHRLTWLAGGP